MKIKWRLSDVPIKDTDSDEMKTNSYRNQAKCTIFLSYTSNIISSGLRETIKFLVKNKLVSFFLLAKVLYIYRIELVTSIL